MCINALAIQFLSSTPPAITLDSSQAEESVEEEEEGGEEGERGEESEGEEEGSEPTLDTTLPETEGKTANNGHVSRTSGRKSVH